MRVAITRSESFNHHNNYTPDKAHDGDYSTHYSPKDNALANNFLKLYLTQTFSIGKVIMVSREGWPYAERMVNTEVRVYSTVGGENELASCGKITGKSSLQKTDSTRQLCVAFLGGSITCVL